MLASLQVYKFGSSGCLCNVSASLAADSMESRFRKPSRKRKQAAELPEGLELEDGDLRCRACLAKFQQPSGFMKHGYLQSAKCKQGQERRAKKRAQAAGQQQRQQLLQAEPLPHILESLQSGLQLLCQAADETGKTAGLLITQSAFFPLVCRSVVAASITPFL